MQQLPDLNPETRLIVRSDGGQFSGSGQLLKAGEAPYRPGLCGAAALPVSAGATIRRHPSMAETAHGSPANTRTPSPIRTSLRSSGVTGDVDRRHPRLIPDRAYHA